MVTLIYTHGRITRVFLPLHSEEDFCGCMFRFTLFLDFPKLKSVSPNNPRSLFLVVYMAVMKEHVVPYQTCAKRTFIQMKSIAIFYY